MVEVYWFVSCRRIKIGLKQNLTSAIFLIWGFHIHLTRATAQPKNPSDVSFFAKQTNDLIVTEKSSAITGLSGSRLYLHVCIGIMSLILVFLTITHFYVSFKKKKKISQRLIEMHVHCQNDGLHPSLDPVYNNIAACPRLEMPDSINHQREEERPKLSSESNSSVFTVKKD